MNKYKKSIEYITNHPDYNNIIDWETYKTDQLIINDKKLKINGNNINKNIPVFQSIVENNNFNINNIIYNDDKIIILIPTCNDTPDSPLNLMSYCHFLIIPKIRIYNASTIQKKHLHLLQYMKDVGSNVMKSILVSKNNSNIPYDILTKKDFTYSDPFYIVKNFKIGLGLHYNSAKKIHKSIKFSVHLAPSHSIGYLHIHCYLHNLMLEYDDIRKNFPLKHILNYFK